MEKKQASSKSDALRNMRESAPVTGEAVDAPETKAAKRIRESAEKKAAKVQAEAEKKAAKIQATADKKAAEKQAAADKKAADKLAREVARTEAKAERERRKAEKEANRKPKTGALTIDQFTAIGGEMLPPLKEPTEDEKRKMAAGVDKRAREFNGKTKQATFDLLATIKWDLWKYIVNPETGKEDFASADDWFKSAMPLCRSGNYKLIKHIGALGPHMSAEDLAETSTRNRQLLIDNPSIDLKDPEIVKAAKGSHKGLKKVVKKKNPNLHIEDSAPIMVPVSVKTKHNEAIEAIIALHELDSNEEAEKALAEYFMQGQTENPNYAGMSNREAYAAYLDAESRPEDEPQADSVPENQPEQVEQ